jgi:lycopene cyclase domain-containing protein
MIGTLLGPFALSFDKKVHFYTHWRSLFLATILISFVYIAWDEVYTQWGVWGFNPEHLQGVYVGHLPIEEICFFLFVPYACIFVYACLKAYFPKVNLQIISKFFAIVFGSVSLLLAIVYYDNQYTGVAALLAFLLTVYFYFLKKVEWYADFVFTFLIVQIPFFFVNGALTGMFTREPIVWYNEEEIIGLRWVSIPFEDTFYNYGFLILIFSLYFYFQRKRKIV